MNEVRFIPFSCPQSFPASGSFLMSRLFTSWGQSSGAELCILSFLNCLFLNEFLELELEAGKYSEERIKGNSLVIQWLGRRAFPAKGKGSIPGQGLKSGKL